MPHNQSMPFVVKETINQDACRVSFERWIRQILDHCTEPIIKLGNVHFWIDEDGPWADQLSFDLPNERWDCAALAKSIVEKLERINAKDYVN